MSKFSGGFILQSPSLIRKGIHNHAEGLGKASVSPSDLCAINLVQRTPWRINGFILDNLLEADRLSLALPSIPLEQPLFPPSHASYDDWRASLDRGERRIFTDEEWAKMPDDARKAHTSRMRELYEHNAGVFGRRCAFNDAVSIAQELRDERAIYFPHTRCFRGRIYPDVTTGPHPQGTDYVKALLHFADGKPLGPLGLYWLLIRAANAAGQDKLTLDERVGWSIDHKEDIRASAKDPLKALWWTEGDEPWGLLATCRELDMAWSLEDPTEFVSHLPVPMDGTCNGLQHLSAMGLDETGAVATNLANKPQRHDIYMEVAAKVREAIERDAAAGDNPVASAWLPQVRDAAKARKLVKRAVMTTPYGVTDRGIRDQLINDGHAKDLEGPKGASADYLRDRIVDALNATSSAAREIMGWLQEVAKALGKAGLPFVWEVPTGSVIRQAYRKQVETRIVTLRGKISLALPDQKSPINPRKQAAGAAPNFVHSFDAAHLSLTVLLAAEAGVTHFSMIHDSYGTHAADTQELAVSLRQAFVDIYKNDWLQKTAEYIRAAHPHIDIPNPPARGSFDITEVLRSPFFFS